MERSCEPMNKNWIEGAAKQGERAKNREALVIKVRRRRSCSRAVTECFLTDRLAFIRDYSRKHGLDNFAFSDGFTHSIPH